MTLPRRVFLKAGALAMAGAGIAPAWLARAARLSRSRRKVLVAIFQRGAADGLNIVVPHGDPQYYRLRPTIAIPRSDVVDLDGFFGLHPSLSDLEPVYRAKQLAIVEAVGSPDPTRSHFDAQDYMESGTPGRKATADGWLNRALRLERGRDPVRAVALGTTLPRVLQGASPAVAVSSLRDFHVHDAAADGEFAAMYGSTDDALFQSTGRETVEAVKILGSLDRQGYAPANGAVYPKSRVGASLRQIAQMVKAGRGLEVAFADVGGWDTHVNQPVRLANALREFGGALAAFHLDLGDRMEDVVVVTMSEFGRTARENGSRGTDHGHANVMFVLGGAVNGGKVHGRWPGLAGEQLYEARDLALTTDFRTVLAEVAEAQLGVRDVRPVFPGFAAPGQLGIMS